MDCPSVSYSFRFRCRVGIVGPNYLFLVLHATPECDIYHGIRIQLHNMIWLLEQCRRQVEKRLEYYILPFWRRDSRYTVVVLQKTEQTLADGTIVVLIG
jgi:hypothetical protein